MSNLTRMRSEATDALTALILAHAGEFAGLLGIDATDVDVVTIPSPASRTIAGPTHDIWVTIGDRRFILTAEPE